MSDPETQPAADPGFRVGRWAPWVAAVVLGGALVAVIVGTTPWHLIEVPRPDPGLDFSAAQIARQEEFRRELLPWSTTSWVSSIVVPLVVGFSPLGRRWYERVRPRSKRGSTDPDRRWYLVVPGFVAGLVLLGNLVTLPTDILAERVTREYGLSTEDWALWLRDRAVNWLLTALTFAVIALALIALARRFRRGWWWPAAIAAALLVLGVSYAYPVLVEPRFHEFTSLAPGPQRTEFLRLAQEDGVPVEDVLVADASKRTTTLNAYVSGFGSTRRLVVYDTLLRDAEPAQVRLVVAHELGHAAENDVLHGTMIGTLAAVFSVVLLRILLGSKLADPRRAALLIALLVAGTTLAAPIQNLVSRRIEARADYHSLQLTKDPHNFVAMQHELAVTNLSGLQPSRWRYWLFASHPTTPERIAMGRAWAAQHGTTVPPLVGR